MSKKLVFVNLLVVFSTCLQVLWSTPDAISASNMSTSSLIYIEKIVCFGVIFTTILLIAFWRIKMADKNQIRVICCTTVIYWVFVNFIEFQDRVASWSTFSFLETWSYILVYNSLPLLVSTALFSILLIFIYRVSR